MQALFQAGILLLLAAGKHGQDIFGDPGGDPWKSQSSLKINPSSTQFWASRSSHDRVILPRDTRLVLGECLRLSSLHHVPRPRGQGRMCASQEDDDDINVQSASNIVVSS